MQISTNFALQKIAPNLYSFQFEVSKPHAFEQIFNEWGNAAYLFKFFDEHILDLHSDFWNSVFLKKISIEEAVEQTIEQASIFEDLILDYANQSNNLNKNYLDSIFIPLLKNESVRKPLLNTAFKSYGTASKSWLRVYAIRIDDVYVITGGAIKLTDKMEVRPHTQDELDKLQNAASLLKRNHFNETSDFDLVYIEI